MKNAPREAVIDATLTIDPPPAATRCGQAARVTRNTMSSSCRIVNDQSANDNSPMGPNRIDDALLTSTSIPPARATASSTQRPAPSSVARSTGATASIRPPSARTSSTVSADVRGLRSQPTTWAPSRASRSAVARPIPPPVPETSARFPSSRPMRRSSHTGSQSPFPFTLWKSLSHSESIVNKPAQGGADADDAYGRPGARTGLRAAARQRGDPAQGRVAGGRGPGRPGRTGPARRAPPAQRRRGSRRARRRVVAVGALDRVRRADRQHPHHQPDGRRPAQAGPPPGGPGQRRRRPQPPGARAAPPGTRAGRPVPRRRAGAQAQGGRLPRGGRLADLAVEDAGPAASAHGHVLDAHRRRRPGAVRGRRHAALGRPGHRRARPGRPARTQRGQPARRALRPGPIPRAAGPVPDLPPRRRGPARRGRRMRHLRRPRPAGAGPPGDLDRPGQFGHIHGRETSSRRGDPGNGRPPPAAARADRGASPGLRGLRPDRATAPVMLAGPDLLRLPAGHDDGGGTTSGNELGPLPTSIRRRPASAYGAERPDVTRAGPRNPAARPRADLEVAVPRSGR